MENNHEAVLSKQNWVTQKLLFMALARIQYGKFVITDCTGCYTFSGLTDSTDVANIKINRPQAYKKILLQGVLGAAEGYMEGDWDTDDLTKLIEIILKNTDVFEKLNGLTARILNYILRLTGIYQKNDMVSAKKNIISHYDLGNNFFKLFLDPSMMYSCALYEPERISLEQASIKKLETICQQLQLSPTDHLLEIGTGWGGLAIYAARKYGCKVTTTTISDKQYAHVKQEIAHLGLQNRIELLNQDYRQLKGQYTKLVSIEMIEAVGHQYFDTFFKQCNKLLKPGGLFFLQAIVINDQAYQRAKNEIDFIKRYIFPGGCLPSVNVISNCIANHTQMQLLQIRDIGKHYAITLLDWLRRFNQHTDLVKEQGFSEQFIRMWRFYFCYCAAGFKQAYISDIHALWRKQA
ncbi:MAG: class I SAM-dependent methyltransferase [Gammaproteobacteria bacterium]|nr:class I SAM-dependent methyltransferase [Gammaproteobacteria bacterium]MCW5583269.1 class I SAM-dependent methyltransferase [Gammaproteobacteria bacterium]